MPDAARVAVTVHVVTRVVVKTSPVMLQPLPATEKEYAPFPEPPDAVTLMDVPATPVRDALVITTAAWAAPANVKVTGALVSLA